jgi:hypothetical protein
MEYWLEWFDRRMAGRKVLLLLDNFSAHESALQNLQLQNVRVIFLPLNAASRCQPCNQGMIKALKGHYRLNFTHCCLEQWEEGKDPMQEVNLLMAIRWVVSAWQLDVQAETVENCVLKSRVIKNLEEELEDDEVGLGFRSRPPVATDTIFIRSEIESTTAQMVAYNYIQHPLPPDEYVELANEAVLDPDDDIIEHIVATIDVEEAEAPEAVAAERVAERVTNDVALASVDSIVRWFEQQSDSTYDLQAITRLRKTVHYQYRFARSRQQQQTLDSWFK